MAARAEAQRRGEQRPQQVRAANARVAREAERQKFLARLPMLCECDDGGCEEVFLIAPADFRAACGPNGGWLTIPHHRLDGAELARKDPEYWLQRRD
jgi:hypothetical protein